MAKRRISSLLFSRKSRRMIVFALVLVTLSAVVMRPQSLYGLFTSRFEPVDCDIMKDNMTSSISGHISGEDMPSMNHICQNVIVVFSGFYRNMDRESGNPAYRLFFSNENGEIRAITIYGGCVYDNGTKYQIVKNYDLFLEEIEQYFAASSKELSRK